MKIALMIVGGIVLFLLLSWIITAGTEANSPRDPYRFD